MPGPRATRARIVAFLDAFPASGKSYFCEQLSAELSDLVFKDADDISQTALATSVSTDRPLGPILARELTKYLRSLPPGTRVVMCGVSVFDDAGDAVPLVPDLASTTAPKFWLNVGSNGYSNIDVALARSVLREFRGGAADWKEARAADPSDVFFKMPIVTRTGRRWDALFKHTLAPANLDALRAEKLPRGRTVGDYIDAMRAQYAAENILGNEDRAARDFGFVPTTPTAIASALRRLPSRAFSDTAV